MATGIHDWTRVTAGIYHHFHHEWISAIQRELNAHLPPDHYALAEQIAGGLGPDVLTLETGGPTFEEFAYESAGDSGEVASSDNGVAVAAAPPHVMYTLDAEPGLLLRRKNRVVIRHSSDHRVVAVIEIVSPGNKNKQQALVAFVQKAYDFVMAGVHLLIIDVLPPGPRDPQGIHPAIWSAFGDDAFTLPSNQQLTLAAYSAGELPRAYVQPVGVGEMLPEMPVFLQPEIYIPLQLQPTYEAAFAGVPKIWQQQLEPES